MITIAAGMESENSDSECDMVFSNIKEPDTKNSQSLYKLPVEIVPSNGVIGNSTNKPESRHKFRGSSKFHTQNRNQCMRGQCLDFQSSQLLDDLRYAINNGNLEATKNILDKGIMADTILQMGWTGLMHACSSGYPEIVALLLKKKADSNYHKDMFTPLMAVCASKKCEDDLLKCCSLLLQYKANVNAHERHYMTPLMFASREGYYQIVQELINNGADLNMQDNRGNTALAWAASSGYGKVVRILIEKGADINILNNMGQSSVDMAYENGHNEVVSLIQNPQFLKQSISGEDSTDLARLDPAIKEISRSSRPRETKKFGKIGELELFLTGIDLSDLVPLFVEHQLLFHDLLIMDDEELEKVGITQVGVRKKLLEACKSVHKKEWQNSSLPNLKQSQFISCPDAVAMMANISKHLRYITSSVVYIRQQIQSHPRILELSQDSASVYNLIDEMDDSLKNVHVLNDELRFFKMHLEKVQDQDQYIPADFVVETVPFNRGQGRLLYIAVGMTAASVVIAGLLWKYPQVLDSVPTYVRIRIPFLR